MSQKRRRSSSIKNDLLTFQKFDFDLKDHINSIENSQTQEEFNKIKKKFNLIEHHLPIDDLVKSLFSDLKRGINQSHATRLLKKNGKNKLNFFDSTSYFDLCRDFFGGFGIILWIGTFIFIFAYVITYIFENEYLTEYLWLGIFLAVFNVLNSFFSIYQNEKTLEIVSSYKSRVIQTTIVTRDAQKFKISSEKLVPGDLIELNEGDIIPADIRIIKAYNLKTDSFRNAVPEYKSAMQNSLDPFLSKNLAFMGDHIYEGTGQGIVLRTGEKTLYSYIAHQSFGYKLKTKKYHKPHNILIGVTRFVQRIKIFAVLIGLIYCLKSYLWGYSLLQSAKFAIGLIIAQVPECLMITVSIVLGLAIKKLEKKNLIVKNIDTIGKLGAISIVCSDKSGTLTQNKMRVKNIWYNDTFKDLDTFEVLSDISLRRIIEIHPILYDALMCNSVTFLEKRNRPSMNRSCVGDPTDIAILKCIEDLFGNLIDFQKLHPKVYEIPFNPVNKFQLSIHESAHGYRIVMKGAPELILEKCSKIFINEQTQEMSQFWLKKSNHYLTTMAEMGHRVIGFADYILDPIKYPKNFEFLINELGKPNFPIGNEMRFLGLISLVDPLRPNTSTAVKKCKSAGIKVIMITGDHPLTAESIAKEVGIFSPDSSIERFGFPAKIISKQGGTSAAVVDGTYLSKMNGTQLDSLLNNYQEIVFARTTPLQKERIVKGYQRIGEFVAVTGDGANDCRCLKSADVGIAMGITGKDVSKEAADMILLDDNFATIQNAIEEGRLIHDNLKKSISHTLTSKIAVFSPFLMYIIADIPLAIGTIGILTIDFVTEIIPPIYLAFEKPESDLMTRPPIDKNDQLVSMGDYKNQNLLYQRMISVTYGIIGMLEASAGYLMYTEIMTSNGFFPSRLLGIRKSWESEAVNDLEDSYGQEWTYQQRKSLEDSCHSGFFFAIWMLQITYFIVCRGRVISVLKKGIRRDFAFYFTLALLLILALFFLYTPGLNDSIHMHPLRLYRWVLVPLPFAIHVFAFDEIRKYLMKKYPNSWFTRCMSW